MNKLILKATEVNSTTVIPNFGAIMKMGKTFMYNEFLKYDDGKLAQFIAESKGIDINEAKEQIKSWVVSLQSDLDAGKTVVFDGVGEIVKADGKLKFTANAATTSSVKLAEKKVETPPVVDEPKKEVKKVDPEVKTPEEPKEKKEEKSDKKDKKEVKIGLSTDFKAKEAVDQIESFKDKNSLIEFTRGEDRKTVVAALNAKLDEFNGKKKDKKEIKEEPTASTEIKAPKNAVTEVKAEPKEEKTEKKTTVVPPVVEKPKVEEVKPAVSKEEKLEEKKEVVKPEPPKPAEKPVVKEEKSIKEKAAAIEKPKENKEEEEAAIAAIVGGVEETEKQTKKRKKRWILWAGLILILLGGGTVGYLKKDIIMGWFDKTHEPKDLAEGHEDGGQASDDSGDGHEADVQGENTEHSEATDHVEEPVNDTNTELVEESVGDPVVEEVVEEPVVEEPVKETPVVNSSSEGSWHIVAGSYSSKSNAENKVEKLKSEGYSNAKILGKYNGLYTVRVASYSTKDEAKSALASYTGAGNKGFIKNL